MIIDDTFLLLQGPFHTHTQDDRMFHCSHFVVAQTWWLMARGSFVPRFWVSDSCLPSVVKVWTFYVEEA